MTLSPNRAVISHERQRQFRRLRRRRPSVEPLEGRRLLAANPFGQNPLQPLDVSRDGRVSALDALRVINALNRAGSNSADPADSLGNFIDVTGDGRGSAVDALRVINALNGQSPILAALLTNDTGPANVAAAPFDLVTNDYGLSITASVAPLAASRVELHVGNFSQPVDITDRFIDGTARLSVTELDELLGRSLPDGEHVVTTRLDGETVLTFPLTVDRAAPHVELVSLPESSRVSPTIRFVGRQIDANPSGEVTVSIAGVNQTIEIAEPGSFDAALGNPVASGANQLQAVFSDLAGNTSSLTRNFDVDANLVTGAASAGGWVATSDQLIVIGGRDSFVVQADRLIDRTTAAHPRLEFSVDVNDNEDVGTALLVYLLDAANPSLSALDEIPNGQPIFRRSADGVASYPAGLVRFDGQRLSIDLTDVSQNQTLVRVQRISDAPSPDSLIRASDFVVEDSSTALSSRSVASLAAIKEPGPAVALASFTATDSLTAVVRNRQFSDITNQYVAELTLTSPTPISPRPVVIKFPGLPAGVTLTNASGFDAGDIPYITLPASVTADGWRPGQPSAPVRLVFSNPGRVQLPISPDVFIGQANQPPSLAPIGDQTITPGDVRELRLSATDPDGDAIAYRIAPVQNSVLPTGSIDAAGVVQFSPTPDELGTYQVQLVAFDGHHESSETITINVVADPITTTRVSGRILDVDGSPLVGMQIDLGQVSVLTDADGRFTLDMGNGPLVTNTLKVRGEIFPGTDTYPYIAEKLPLVLGRDPFTGVNNVISRPIYLPKIDVAGGQLIDPMVDTIITSAGVPESAVEVAGGTLFNQQGTSFDGVLSITEVPSTLTPAVLPSNLQPDIVLTIQPGDMVFTAPAPLTFPNRSGFAPGTRLDLWSINPVTGRFDDVGDMQVSSDGSRIETISGGIRNSSWHFPAPPPPTPRPPQIQPENQDQSCPPAGCSSPPPLQPVNDACGSTQGGMSRPSNCQATVSANSEVELHSGALLEMHALASYTSLGTTRGLTLHYDSQRADPRPIVHFGFDNTIEDDDQRLVASLSVSRGEFTAQVDGANNGRGVIAGQHYFSIPEGGGNITAALQGDLRELPTGIYQTSLRQGLMQLADGAVTGTTVTQTSELIHVNERDSPFGAGWNLAGTQRLVTNPDGNLLLVDGSGTTIQYAPGPSEGSYLSPSGDFSTLVRLGNGTFERTMTDQSVYRYNVAGRLISYTDRNGNATTNVYENDRLTNIIDPVGLETRLTYSANGKLSTITDPSGRITSFAFDSEGNLIRITDPDGNSREFVYDNDHRLIQETDQRGNVEQTFYGFHGRVERSIRKDGSEMFFEPLQTRVLLPLNATLDPVVAPPAALAGASVARVVDSNGNITETNLNRLGQSVSSTDDESESVVVQRNADNLIVAQTDSRGFITRFGYDDRGNLTSLDRPSSLAGPAAPVRLTSGQTVQASLNDLPGSGGPFGPSPLDYDIFSIDASAGDELLISFGLSTSSLEAIVLDPSGAMLHQATYSRSSAAFFRSVGLSETGNHSILVRNPNGSTQGQVDYLLTAIVIDADSDADTVDVVSGQTVDAALEARGDLDTFRLQANVGDDLYLTFREVNNSFSNLQFVVFDPLGNELDQATVSAGGTLTLENLSIQGGYTILIRDADGVNAGSYRFTATIVNSTPDDDSVRLQSGQTVRARLDAGDLDTFTIAAVAGDDLHVSFREIANSFSNLQVVVFDPEGTPVAESTQSTGGVMTLPDVATPGEYTLIVRDLGGVDVGDYQLTATVIDTIADDDTIQLISGRTVRARLDPADLDTFTINTVAGDDLHLSFREVFDSFSNLQVIVFDPTGSQIANLVHFSGGAITLPDLATSGFVTILVLDADGANVGDYQLTATVIDSVADDGAVPLESGQTVRAGLDAGDLDTFVVRADAGDDLYLSFREAANSFSTLQIIVFDPAGFQIAESTHFTGGALTLPDLSRTGGYIVMVRDAGGVDIGDYQLTATVIDETVDANTEVLINAQRVNATLGQSDMDSFRFDAQANDALAITFSEVNNPFSDLQVILFSPGGEQITSETVFSSGMIEIPSLTETGSYQILVRDANGTETGDYRIQATLNGIPDAGERTAVTETIVAVSQRVPLPVNEFATQINESAPRTVTESAIPNVSELIPADSDLGQRSLETAGEIDEVQWAIESGGSLFVTIAANPLDLRIRIIDPAGAEIASVSNTETDSAGRVNLDLLDLTLAGVYTMEVTADDGVSTGDYQLITTVMDSATSVQVGLPRRMEYDETFSQLISMTDELGRLTLYTLDPATGNTVALREVVGNFDDVVNGETDDLITTMAYTSQGLIKQVTDPLGRVTEFQYDSNGRLTSTTFAVGTPVEARRQFEYDSRGNQTAIVDENGNRTEMRYDELDRLISVIEADPDGAGPITSPETSFVYDATGNLILTTDATGGETITTYDPLNRPTLVRDDLGNETTTHYDRLGNVASLTDPNGNVTRFTYDTRSRRTATTDPDGGVTRFDYDADNNLIALIDPVGNRTEFAYDGRDRMIRETDPLDAVTHYAYDPVDSLIRKTDRNGRITQFTYDELDRLVNETWHVGVQASAAHQITFDYDKLGNLLSIEDDFSRYDYTYDERNRLTDVDMSLIANLGVQALAAIEAGEPNRLKPSLQHSLTYAYDDVGNVLSVTDGFGATTTTAYDALNRPIAMEQSGGGATEKAVDLAFNQIGQYESISRYSDVARTAPVAETHYIYDDINRLTDLDHTDATDNVLAFYDFSYDSASRITRIADVTGTTNYSYDDRDQLTGASRGTSDIRGSESYEYDANGNRLDSHLHGENYETGDANRLLSDGTYTYQHDDEGNMVRRTEVATGDYRTFEFDHRNRLFRVTDFSSGDVIIQEVTYTYDAMDRRIARTVDNNGDEVGGESTEMFVYDREDVQLDYEDGDGSFATESPEHAIRYFHGPGIDQVLAREIIATGENQWFLADHLGTTRELVGDDGGFLNRLSYDSFGNLVDELNSAFSTRYQFTGREFDEAIRLHYYRARFFNAEIGRFVSEDPIGFDGGDTNVYRYVYSRPLDHIDPYGLESGYPGYIKGRQWTPGEPIPIGAVVGPPADDVTSSELYLYFDRDAALLQSVLAPSNIASTYRDPTVGRIGSYVLPGMDNSSIQERCLPGSEFEASLDPLLTEDLRSQIDRQSERSIKKLNERAMANERAKARGRGGRGGGGFFFSQKLPGTRPAVKIYLQ